MADQQEQGSGGAQPDAPGDRYGGPPPEKKATPVWLWVLLGCGGLVILVLVAGGALFALGVSRAQTRARKAVCKSHLRQIGLACHMYADDNNEKFPPDLAALQPAYVDNPKVLSCPANASARYVYLPGRRSTTSGDFVLAYEGPANHGGSGFNVLYCDAHVEWWPAARREAFEKLLADQEAAVKKQAAAKALP